MVPSCTVALKFLIIAWVLVLVVKLKSTCLKATRGEERPKP